jgi:molybdopterin converting factor small subunit
MMVQVKYQAQARMAAGVASESIQLADGCSVEAAVRQLAQRHGDVLGKHVLRADGRLSPFILLFVDDRQVIQPDALTLSDNDTLTILSPMAGG